jgi:hypothetical protein
LLLLLIWGENVTPELHTHQRRLYLLANVRDLLWFGRALPLPPYNDEQWASILMLTEVFVNASDSVIEGEPIKDWLDAYRLWLDSTRRKTDG